jgi:transcriptional regulator GlxA family with amidase domain
MENTVRMLIAIPLFDRVTALDGIGPYEVLHLLPDAEIRFVGEKTGPVRADRGFLGLQVDATFEDTPAPDVVVVPGGPGTRPLMNGSALVDWIRAVHPNTRWTTSVCTGALILGGAGLLDGLEATTHWAAYDELAAFGAKPTERRVVEHPEQRIITAAGVSSGIDMALRLTELLTDVTTAEAAQLVIEYDPQPPFDAGSPSKAGDKVKARAAELLKQMRS